MDIDKIKDINDLKGILRRLENELADAQQDNKTLKSDVRGLRAIIGLNSKNSYAGDWDTQKSADFGAIFAYLGGNRTEKVVNRFAELHSKTALGTSLTSDSTTGSYAVPEQFIDDIYSVLETESELWPLTTRVEQTSNSAKYPKGETGFSFSRVAGDVAATTEKNPTFSELDLDVLDFAGYVPVSLNWMEDSLSNVGQYMRDIMREGLVASVETNFLNNASNPTGLLQNTSVASSIMGGSSFSDLGADDLMALIQDLTTKKARRGGRFIMHSTVMDVVSLLKNAQGDYIFREATDAMPPRAHGSQIIQSDQMPALSDSAASTAFIAYGNPRHLLYGSKKDLQIDVLDKTSYMLTNRQVFFLAMYRASFTNAYDEGFSILKTAT